MPGRPAEPLPAAEAGSQTSLSPGVGALLRGEQAAAAKLDAEPSPAVGSVWRRWAVVKWLLLAADVLLLSLASLLVFKRSGPLSFPESALCFSSLAIGAALSLVALLGGRNG